VGPILALIDHSPLRKYNYSSGIHFAKELNKIYLINIIKKNWWNELFWVTGHCNPAAVSRNRYGVEQTVNTHTILINAIQFYVCLQEI
jgi:hypothetical protein